PSYFLLPVLRHFLIFPRPPISTRFPYTTLFRSRLPLCDERAQHVKRLRAEILARLDVRVLHELVPAYDEDHVRTGGDGSVPAIGDRKSTRLNSSHVKISYAVFCLKKKSTAQLGA